MGACVSGYLTQTSGSPASQANRQAGYAFCNSGPGASSLAAATAEFTGTIQPGVAQAAAAWPNLSDLTGFLAPAAGVLNSADSASVSSTGTVTSTTRPRPRMTSS